MVLHGVPHSGHLRRGAALTLALAAAAMTTAVTDKAQAQVLLPLPPIVGPPSSGDQPSPSAGCGSACPSPSPSPPPPSPSPGPPPPRARNGLPCPGPALSPRRRRRGGLALGQHAVLHTVSGAAMCARAQAARRSGARFLREDFYWAVIERGRGRFDWRYYDRLMAVAAQHGLTVLPLLGYPPPWAARNSLTIPTRHGPYGRFVARVVARYGPGGTFWRLPAQRRLARLPAVWFELFNEPYYALFSQRGVDPGNYARLVRSTVRRARAANRRARFLLSADSAWTAPDRSVRDWMADMYVAVPDLGRWFDGVSVHPYSNVSPNVFTPDHDTRGQSRRLERVRDFLGRRGETAKHLWITEVGWTTCPRPQDACLSEAEQAAYLEQLFRLARTRWRGYVDVVFGYELRDHLPPGYPFREGFFGLLRADGSPKPAWDVFRTQAG